MLTFYNIQPSKLIRSRKSQNKLTNKCCDYSDLASRYHTKPNKWFGKFQELSRSDKFEKEKNKTQNLSIKLLQKRNAPAKFNIETTNKSIDCNVSVEDPFSIISSPMTDKLKSMTFDTNFAVRELQSTRSVNMPVKNNKLQIEIPESNDTDSFLLINDSDDEITNDRVDTSMTKSNYIKTTTLDIFLPSKNAEIIGHAPTALEQK